MMFEKLSHCVFLSMVGNSVVLVFLSDGIRYSIKVCYHPGREKISKVMIFCTCL